MSAPGPGRLGSRVAAVVCWCPVGVVQVEPAVGVGVDAPAGVVFEPVVVGAVRGEVGFAGGAAVGPGGDVVEFGVGGSSAAADEPAVDVPGSDVVGECGGWVVGGAAVVEQGAREGVGDQAAPDAVGGGLAGEGGGDGADTDEFGGVVVGADQGGVRDDDLDQRLARVHRLDRAARTGRDDSAARAAIAVADVVGAVG